MKKPKAKPKPETERFYCKGNGHWKWNCPRYLVDEKAGKVDRSILDIRYMNVYFTSTPSSTRVLDTSSVAKC